MRFNVVLLADGGFRYLHFLFDPARMLCDALEDLGHPSILSRNNLVADRVNVLLAAHTIRDPAVAQQIADAGIDYVVLQSEVVRDGQVNLAGDREQFERCYLPLLAGARVVWEGLPEQVPILRQMGLPVRRFFGGYHPCMEVVSPRRSKDIDFLFIGSVSEHRRRLLKSLESRGHRVVVCFDAPALYRDDLIARSRVHLAPRRMASMRHLAYGRILSLVANRVVVAVERCADQGWLEDCFVHADTQDWVDLCERTLARDDLDELGQTFYERVRSKPLLEHLGPLVDELAIASD